VPCGTSVPPDSVPEPPLCGIGGELRTPVAVLRLPRLRAGRLVCASACADESEMDGSDFWPARCDGWNAVETVEGEVEVEVVREDEDDKPPGRGSLPEATMGGADSIDDPEDDVGAACDDDGRTLRDRDDVFECEVKPPVTPLPVEV